MNFPGREVTHVLGCESIIRQSKSNIRQGFERQFELLVANMLSAITDYVQSTFIRNPLHLMLFVLTGLIIYGVGIGIYRIYFDALSQYPGPKRAAVSPLWRALSYIRGTGAVDVLAIHNKYGPIVRIAPDELSYINPIAWEEIYGHRKGGAPELTKDKNYHAGMGSVQHILNAERQYHGELRKLLAHGFSDKALRTQEATIQQYVDTLIEKLGEEGQNGTKAVDLVDWFNYFTFDTIGYLTYAESFNLLGDTRNRVWVRLFLSNLTLFGLSQAIGRLPRSLQSLYRKFYIPQGVKEDAKMEFDMLEAKVQYRLQTGTTEFPDFMSKLVDAYEKEKMSGLQLHINAKTLMLAGSETTATWLVGTVYWLMRTPRVLDRVSQEIRSKFATPEEITMTSVNECTYLSAVIEESLRIYPPSPSTHARYVPEGGMMIDGQFVPGGTAVGTTIHAVCNSSANFRNPGSFVPERWTGEMPEYANDKKQAAQFFSTGPRNCIGRNLSYLETRLVIAKLLWHFDPVYVPSRENWLDQKIFMVWQKPPMLAKLKPRQNTARA